MAALLALVAYAGAVGCGATFEIGDKEFSHVWRAKRAMPAARSDLTATTVGDAIYLVGGCNNDQEWSAGAGMYLCTGITKDTLKYLPLTDSYESLPEAPRSRYRHAAAAVGSRVFVFGGSRIDDGVVEEVDVLDTQAGQWSTLAGLMPFATSDLSAFAHGGKIYTLGGYGRPDYNASAKMMIFDPATEGWSEGPSLVQGRGDAAAALAGGRAYALGGFHHGDWSFPMDHLETFDPAFPGDGWRVRRNMSVARGDKAVAVLHDLLHVVGGESKNVAGHSLPLMDVEVYEAATDRWYGGGSIPSHRFRFVAAAHGNSLFIFGGQGALSGSHGAAGSRYPVVDAVDEYEETKTTLVSAARAIQALHAGAAFLAFLSMLLF